MQNVNASIITIGDELLIGQTIDTNSAWIAQELNKIGVWVKRRVAVGDVWDDIWHALDEEKKDSEIIIITGGLGPTADDITKQVLCKYFDGKMVMNEQVLEHIKYLFEKVYGRQGPLLERNIKQAEVPDNCTVLFNKRGTAPGMWFEPPQTPPKEGLTDAQGHLTEKSFQKHEKSTLSKVSEAVASPVGGSRKGAIVISLPGVPYEMEGLIIDEVLPRLQKTFQLSSIIHRTAFTAGQGESFIAELIRDFETSLPVHIKLAYLPGYGLVRLRLTASGPVKVKLEKELEPLFLQLTELVKDFLVTNNDDELQIVIGKILKEKGKTMATAESCTGGYIAHLITSVAGSSAYYKGSVISYANEAKETILGVRPETLNSVGAVSEETVIEMVKGALQKLNTDYAVATSGIMGPDGGSEEKPVGTVWIAVGKKDKSDSYRMEAKRFLFRFERDRNIMQTAFTALNMLRKFILENPG